MKRIVLVVILSTFSLFSVNAFAAKSFKAGEFTFTAPEKWEWVETGSTMRKAQLKVADPEKKQNAEVVFFHFGPGSGGGTQANVDRWLGQFKEPKDKIGSKVEDTTVKGRKVTYVQAQGTYLSGMPGGAKTEQPDSMLLGAIIESDEGNVFVRMTGPSALVKSSKENFTQMIEGAVKAR